MQRSPISLISSMRCEMKTTDVPADARPPQDREQAIARLDIERGCGLVQDQDRGSLDRAHGRCSTPGGRTGRGPPPGRSSGGGAAMQLREDGPPRASRFSGLGDRSRAPARRRPSRRSPAPSAAPRPAPPGTPSRCRPRSLPSASRRRRSRRSPRRNLPASGRWMPDRIFTSVLLPEPFSPTIAWISPRRSSKSASRSACVGPNAFMRPDTRSAVSGAAAPSSPVADGLMAPAFTNALSPLD